MHADVNLRHNSEIELGQKQTTKRTLSEQMTEVHPKVSTEGSERTMAFFFAIRLVPRARQVVMTAGRPSGIAATARATAIYKP